MTNPGAESRQQEVASISRGLKALAKELRVPVVAMAQLNRNPEDRSSNRPRMSDLRESGAIEQDADVIGLLHRDSYYKVGEDPDAEDDNKAELIIAKQRNGPVGTIDLYFDRRFTRFNNPQIGGHHNVPEAGGDVNFP
jgi:replicative DNA helicase